MTRKIAAVNFKTDFLYINFNFIWVLEIPSDFYVEVKSILGMMGGKLCMLLFFFGNFPVDKIKDIFLEPVKFNLDDPGSETR